MQRANAEAPPTHNDAAAAAGEQSVTHRRRHRDSKTVHSKHQTVYMVGPQRDNSVPHS